MPRNRALTPSVYSAVLFRFRWPSTPRPAGFLDPSRQARDRKHGGAHEMNVLHPDPIGRNGQLTGKPIGRHLRPALRRENPLVGFTIAVERGGRRCLFVEGRITSDRDRPSKRKRRNRKPTHRIPIRLILRCLFLLDFTAEVRRHFRFRSSVRRKTDPTVDRQTEPHGRDSRGTFAMFVRFRPHG
jgi:hypothetical protein